MAAVSLPKQVSVPGFTLEFASEQFYEGNIEQGRRYFKFTANLCPEMASAVYRGLWMAQGSPQGNPCYGEDCFHGRQGLSATGREIAGVIQQYWENLSDARAQQGGDPYTRTFFQCPISFEIMRDPVIDHCGHSFEQENIRQWMNEGRHTCPFSEELLEINEFRPNLGLKAAIEACDAAHRDEPRTGETMGQAFIRERNINMSLMATHEVATNRLKWGIRQLVNEYINLEEQSHQLQQSIIQRNGIINQLQVTIGGQATTIADQATTIRGQATKIADQATAIRDQATTIADQATTIRDQNQQIANLALRLTKVVNQLKNIQNIGFRDAAQLAVAPLFGERKVVIQKIINR